MTDEKTANRPKHFVLVGHHGCHNRGCEALVRSTIAIIREHFPDAFFSIASLYPETNWPLLDLENIEIVPGVCRLAELYVTAGKQAGDSKPSFASLIVKSILPYFVAKRVFDPKKYKPIARPMVEEDFDAVLHLRKTLESSDLVISIGGDLFIEDYGTPFYALQSLEYAQHLGCRTMVLGASIWPIKTPWLKKRLAQMLDRCDAVTVRDEPTLRYLKDSLKIKSPTTLTADGAFIMEAAERDTDESVSTRPLLGFNGSNLLKLFLSARQYRLANEAIIRFLQWIIDEQGHDILFVPHDAHPGAAERDYLYEIAELLGRPQAIHFPRLALPAQETKAMIGQCELFFAMRFHPSIASLSMGIPTMGIAYSPKFSGLHQQVMGHSDLIMNHTDITLKNLQTRFGRLVRQKEAIKKQLQERLPTLATMAKRNGDVIEALLRKQ